MAFTTPTGSYKSTVLTFTVTNASRMIQRFINRIFRNMIANNDVIVYSDDILVMGKDVAKHDAALSDVLILSVNGILNCAL